jgi:hypothetical protein
MSRPLTEHELLSIWERGEGQRPSRRALALLSGAAPDATTAELAAVPIGRRDRSLIELRQQLFGSAFEGVTKCPACDEEVELTFDAREVTRDPSVEPSELRVVDGPYDVEVRIPSTDDLAVIDSIENPEAARDRLFGRCVIRARRDGEVVSAEELPSHVVGAVSARMAAADPQADVQLDVDCPACAHAWREPFDIVGFLWTELAVFARRLLSDVHELASAYGWSEEQILGLSPARRSAYLGMLR